MTITVGNYGLIEEPVEWKIAAGADSYAGPFLLTDEADAPINLTGYTAACQIRKAAGGALLADLSTDDDITIDGPAGSVLVHLPAAASAAWAANVRTGVFDIELTNGAGIVQRLCTGTVAVSPNVTTEVPA